MAKHTRIMANTMNAFFSSISFTEFTEIYIVGGSSAKNSEFQNILLCTLIHVVDIMHLPVKKANFIGSQVSTEPVVKLKLSLVNDFQRGA